MAKKDVCSLCDGDYDPECGGTKGYFGTTEIIFCEWCYSSVIDMAKYHLGLTEEDG